MCLMLMFITIPYTYVAISLCLMVGFFKIGALDDEIGPVLGLGTGILVLIFNHFLTGGYGGLALCALGGFALLTVYKIIRGTTETKRRDRDIDQTD